MTDDYERWLDWELWLRSRRYPNRAADIQGNPDPKEFPVPDPDPGDVTPQQQGNPQEAVSQPRGATQDGLVGGRPRKLSAWPDVPVTDITGPLSRYELSGVSVSPEGEIWVCDDGGKVFAKTRTENWRQVASSNLDLEGICWSESGIWLINERNTSVSLINTNGSLIRQWDLRGHIQTPDNWGIEGIAILPTGNIAVGSQHDGKVYVFTLLVQSGQPLFRKTLGPFHDGQRFLTRDLSDLCFYRNHLWCLYDTDNRVVKTTVDGKSVAAWALPTATTHQEGLAFEGSDLLLAEDSGRLLRYRGWLDSIEA